MTDENLQQPHYLGHRQRLRDKLLNNGSEALADYELLELVLSIAIPRRDVKPLAKELINTFKTFGGVITANQSDLKQVKGVGDTVIATLKIIEASQIKTLKDKIENTSIISSWTELIDYCKLNIGNKDTEEFHILYLNTKCHLIKDETHSTGTINTSSVYPREILKEVLKIGATSIIIVHNHPTGDTTPSKADIQITNKIKETLKTIDVSLHDHLIVAKGNYISFKMLGLL